MSKPPNPWPWLFLAPFAVAFGLFTLYPLGRTLAMSLRGPAGVDMGQYAFAAGDPLLWLALVNTLVFAIAFACLQVPVSLGVALLIHHSPPPARRVLAAIFFGAHLVGSVFAGVLFAAMLSGRRGLVNALLLRLGITDVALPFLEEPAWAMPILILVAGYLGVGFGMIYCLAALRQVDVSLLDAARVEGAGRRRRLWHVTLPQVRPTLAFLFVAAVFWGLQAFELPYVLFGGPGPGYRVLTATMYLFALAFEQGQPAYASAVAMSFALMVGLVTLGLVRLLRLGREEVVVP